MKKLISMLLILALLLNITACGTTQTNISSEPPIVNENKTSESNSTVSGAEEPSIHFTEAEDSAREAEKLSSEDAIWLKENCNTFANQTIPAMLSQENGEIQNALFSPLGFQIALSMLNETGNETTEKIILPVIQPVQEGNQKEYIEKLMNTQFQTENSFFKLDNSVLMTDDITLSDNASAILSQYYSCTYDVLESTDTEAIIRNIIHFKDRWVEPFYPTHTANDVFYTSTEEVTIPFMNSTILGRAIQADNFTTASLVFQSGYQFHAILPTEGTTPQDLLQQPDFLQTALNYNNSEVAKVEWKLPKLSFDNEFVLNDLAKQIGLEDIYYSVFPEFNGKTLTVANISQESIFTLDEEGAEAESITDIDVESDAFQGEEEPEYPLIQMHTNRPFLFIITTSDHIILFSGIVNDPS